MGLTYISIGGCQDEKVSRKSGISFNAKAQPLESLSEKNITPYTCLLIEMRILYKK